MKHLFAFLAFLFLFAITAKAQPAGPIFSGFPPGGVGAACLAANQGYLMPITGGTQLVLCDPATHLWTIVAGGGGGTCTTLAGDVTGSCAASTVGKINGVLMAGLTTGILKNTTTTGVPSIAGTSDICGLLSLTGPITSTACATAIANSVNLPGTPTTTTQATGDASSAIATDSYISNALASINPAVSVEATTTGVLSNTPTYANGSSGVGATLTAGSVGVLTVDGYSPAINEPILVKNQAASLQNGIYTLTTVGTGGVAYVLTRRTDYNTPTNINYTGTVPVLQGTVNANTGWNLTTQIAMVGVDALTYTQASAGSSPGPPGGNVKALGSLTKHCAVIGQGGKTIATITCGNTGQLLTSNGSSVDPSWVNPVYVQSFTTQTSVALTHNLGTTSIIVQCYDGSTPPLYIGWNSLALTSTNTATVTFTNAQTGTCVVAGTAAGGGGGGTTGTVQSGALGQFAAYLSAGATVSGQSWSQALSFSATPTFDLSLGSPIMTMTNNVTSITFSNPTTGRPYFIELCQDGTGNRTVAAPTGFAAFMTVGVTASKCNSQAFHYNGSRYIADSTGALNQ